MTTSSFNAVYAIGAIAETLLAAPGSVTCVVDEDQSILSNCIAHILENVDIEHPVGHVINSALQCHHENYHSCTKSLLVMTKMWLREMDYLIQQRVPLDAVLRGFHQAVDQCVQQLHSTKMAVGDVLDSLKHGQNFTVADHTSSSIRDGNRDSSCDRLRSDDSDATLFDASCDRLQEHGGLHDRSNVHERQHAHTLNSASDNMKPTSKLVHGQDDIDDNEDDVSWFFEDSNLNTSDDDALEMMVNAMGDMQDKLGCFMSVDTASCVDRSHVISHELSGDLLPAGSSGMTTSLGRDKGIQCNVLSSHAECQQQPAAEPNELVTGDRQVKLASILQELSKTSKLLIKCSETLSSSADASVSDVSHRDCYVLDVNSANESICHTKTFQMSGSGHTSLNTGVNVSTRLDDDDEFSSCFDDIQNSQIRQDVKTNIQLQDTVVPPAGLFSTSAGLAVKDSDEGTHTLPDKSMAVNGNCVLNSSRHFRTFQSMRPATSTEENSLCVTGEMMHPKSLCHIQNSSGNDATLEVETTRVTPPLEKLAMSDTSGDCQTIQYNSSCSHGTFEGTTLHGTPSKSHVEHVSSTRTTKTHNEHLDTVSLFIKNLGPGSDDILSALTETMSVQLNADQITEYENLRFAVSRVHTVTCVGPLRCDVIDGLVVETDTDQLSLLSGNCCPRRMLLVNGDVSPGFHHKGFTEKTKTCVVSRTLRSDSKKESWLKSLSDVLSELNVGGILVHGNVNEEFREICHTKGIVVFDRVPYKVIQGVSESCLREPTVYVSEATEENVADDVIIRPWSCDWMDHLLTSVSYALIQPGSSMVQTAIISHPCGNVGKMKEETFWHCAHRLHNVLLDGAVLPGAGITEQECAAMLRCSKSSEHVENENMFNSLICQHVAMGLENFAQLVQRNSSFSTTDQSDADNSDLEGATFYDCLKAKIEAWRTAEYLVGVVMGADVEVVTGIDKNYIRTQRGDILGYL